MRTRRALSEEVLLYYRLQFALPGVLVQTVIFASAGTGVGLAEDLQTGIFDRFRSLPISRAAPLLGAIGADIARYLTSGVVMLLVGVLLGFRTGTGPIAALMPLTFGSNVFVPAATMPSRLRAWVEVNLADGARGLLTGGPVAGPVTATLLWAAGIVAVFAPLAVGLYRRRA